MSLKGNKGPWASGMYHSVILHISCKQRYRAKHTTHRELYTLLLDSSRVTNTPPESRIIVVRDSWVFISKNNVFELVCCFPEPDDRALFRLFPDIQYNDVYLLG